MALSADEQELLDAAIEAMPDWFTNDQRQLEEMHAMAKIHGATRAQIKDWLLTQAFISTAEGKTSTTPDWLGQHARDRATRRRQNETDLALRDRLQNIEDALTRIYLLAAVQSMMDAEGVAGSPAMVEMPRDGAYFGTWGQATGTGGTFVGPLAGDVMEFTPDVTFPYPPYHQGTQATGDPATVKVKSGRVKSHEIVISGANSAGNNGTFVSVGLNGNAIRYVNASGVAEADATVDWALQRKDVNDEVLEGTPFAHSYDPTTQGWADRLIPGGSRPGIVTILPLGSSAAFAEAVAEMLRQKKAGGVLSTVERRTI